MNVKKTVKRVLVLLILAGSAYGGYLTVRGADIRMPSLFHPVIGPRLFMSMDGVTFTQSESGRVTWKMDATSTDLYENKEARLKDVKIVFNNPGKGEVTLLGETAIMDTTSGNASVRRGAKDVRVVTSDGYLLTTNSLIWRARERVIRTADPFKLLGKEIYLEGRGFSADVDMRKLKVEERVKAVLQE